MTAHQRDGGPGSRPAPGGPADARVGGRADGVADGTADDPADDPADDRVGDLVDRAIGLLRSIALSSEQVVSRFATAHGLHRTDMHAIAHIAAGERSGEPLSAGLLARRLHVQPSAATSVLDRLEVAGHVRREPHPSDRRRTVVRMQPQALAVAQEFFVPLADRMHAGAEAFTAAELETAVRFLAAMDHQVRAAAEEEPD